MAKTKKQVKIDGDKVEEPKPEQQPKAVATGNAPQFRIVSASYEHNLLCLSLTLYKGKNGISEVFQPIFHFTAHTQSIRCMANGKRYLVSGSNDEHIRIYDLQKRKELGSLLHHSGSITALEFYQDKWLLSGAGDGKLCIWRVKDWEMLGEMKGHAGDINDISIHPSGRLALTAGLDKTLRLWNLMTAKKASVLKLRNPPLKVQWTPAGDHFLVGYDRLVEVYSAETSSVVHEFKLSSPLQHLSVIDIQGEHHLATSHSNGKVIISKLAPLLEGEETESFELQGHAARVKHFSTLRDNGSDYMTTVSSDGKMVVHNLNLKDQIAVYETSDRLNCCLMMPETIERAETMKKRNDGELSEVDTDYSESEAEQATPQPKKKKQKKNKKGKVTVEMEEK